MVIKLAPETFAFPEVAAPGTPDSGYVYIYAKSDGKMYSKDDAGVETELGGGGSAAPLDATYIVQTANGDLTNEQALSALATGIVKVTTGTGVLSSVAAPTGDIVGTSDTQFLSNKFFLDELIAQGRLSAGGNADEVQHTIVGKSDNTQSANMLEIKSRSSLVDVLVNADGGMVINEQGRDTDTRIETDNDANAFFVDGGSDNVGFGTNTPNAAAKVDISSTAKGFLPPRMTTAQFAAISSKPDGLMAYDTDLDEFVGMKNGASAVIGATVVTANKVHLFGAAVTTTSTSMVDVDATNAAITATLTGSGKALVTFSFGANKATSGSAFFRITDGTNSSTEVEFTFNMALSERTVSWIFDTTAGSTTYKLQFRSSNAASANFRGDISAMHATILEIA